MLLATSSLNSYLRLTLLILLTWIRTGFGSGFIKFCGSGSGYNQSGSTSLMQSFIYLFCCNSLLYQGALSAWWGGFRQEKSKSPSPSSSPEGSPEKQVKTKPSETKPSETKLTEAKLSENGDGRRDGTPEEGINAEPR